MEPFAGEWRFNLDELAAVLERDTAVAWLTGTVVAKPEFTTEQRSVDTTQCYSASFTFYFISESDAAMIMPLDVFISHSSNDKDVAEALIELVFGLQRIFRTKELDVAASTVIACPAG